MKKRLVSMLLGTLIVTALVGCGRKTPTEPVVSLPTSVVSEEQTLDSASESETESSEESKESKETSSESSEESKEESSEVAASSESEVPDEREPHESSEESESKEDNTSSKPSESKPSTSKESESKEQSKPSETTTPSTPESKPSESTTPSTPSTPTTPSVPESSAPSESTTPSVPESSTPSEPAHTHNYVTTTISEATCQKAKVVADVCSCGAKINEHEEGEKLAHVYGYEKLRPGWEPTCLKGGRYDLYCANCGEQYGYTLVDPLDHSYVLTDVLRGNCRENAVLYYTCSGCGHEMREASSDSQYRDDHVWRHVEGKEWNQAEECYYYFEIDQCYTCGETKNRVDLGPREE